MEDMKIWAYFLGYIACLIGFAFVAVWGCVYWILGFVEHWEKRQHLRAAIAFVIPPAGLFNGVMFLLKRNTCCECLTNFEYLMAVFECFKLEFTGERKKNRFDTYE
nr:hypothetical protein [Pseudomonas amygdali]